MDRGKQGMSTGELRRVLTTAPLAGSPTVSAGGSAVTSAPTELVQPADKLQADHSRLAEHSLGEVFGSVPVPRTGARWRQMAAFIGPGFLVSVGYMDPGNWATSIAAGSRYGSQLLFVVVASCFMAMLLQSLSARLGLASGMDLAQACRQRFSRPVSLALWVLAELAMVATDLAEVIGSAIGLKLLLGLPLWMGVLLTAFDVLLILGLQRLGFRWIEAVILGLIALVAGCFGAQLVLSHPDFGLVAQGLVPTSTLLTDGDLLYLAIGIVGATVMPHNLYLHSALVQTRAVADTLVDRRAAIRLANIDSILALTLAMAVNAAILILAASTFHSHGRTQVAELEDAYALIAPILGSSVAPVLFALALLACGFSSTVTATLAGQVVMEGFLDLKLPPPVRRLLTRGLAIGPAVLVTLWLGEHGAARLLVFSQVMLSLQLPFAILPLLIFVSDESTMRGLPAPRWQVAAGVVIGLVIVALNAKLTFDILTGAG